MSLAIIEAEWPTLPCEPTTGRGARVRALTTTRDGGLSHGPYASLNLAAHVGDDPARVAGNRDRLQAALHLPAPPRWLNQVHGCAVCTAEAATAAPTSAPPSADAVLTTRPGIVCAVLTADCLPLLLRDRDGTVVAAVHAGWRGLLHGVIESAIESARAALPAQPAAPLLAWLGPAIGPQAFEVGAEVRDAFVAHQAEAAAHFQLGRPGRWLADLYGLARARLASAGVHQVSGADHCTYSDPRRFFSYRRDGVTGRMASLIWIEPD